MDPSQKCHPTTTITVSSPAAASSTTKSHRTPSDPIIRIISNQFSKLGTNHNAIIASLKRSNGLSKSKPRIDTHSQAKAIAVSAVPDTSSASWIKSNCHHSRSAEMREKGSVVSATAAAKVKEKDNKSLRGYTEDYDISKKIESREADEEKGESFEGDEMKRPSISLAINGGRRRSFCCLKTELANFFRCSGVKVVSVDMPPFMQAHAVDCARKVYDNLKKVTSKTLAFTLKKEFDAVYGPAWHCIVGTSFGSFVTHSVGGFFYFSMDPKLYVLLFKTTIQRAD